MDRVSIVRMCAGKEFQVEGAGTQNVWEEKLLVIPAGLVRKFVLGERTDLGEDSEKWVQTGREAEWHEVFSRWWDTVCRWPTGNQCKSLRMFSELEVRGAPTTTRARIFCRRCNLSMFAWDIPCSTVTVIKPTTNDRNSRVKCQKGTYVTHTCLFVLLTYMVAARCLSAGYPVWRSREPHARHSSDPVPGRYRLDTGPVLDWYRSSTRPVPARTSANWTLSQKSIVHSLTVPRPMDNRLRSHSTNLSFLCWSRCPPLYTSGRLADHWSVWSVVNKVKGQRSKVNGQCN